MIRLFSLLAGLFFVAALAWSLLWGGIQFASDGLPKSVEREFHKSHPKPLHLASDGAFGHFDNQQLQRGFQVYQEVCAACHALGQVAYGDLAALGYNEDEVKAIAKGWKTEVPSINPETGEPATRPGLPSGHMPGAKSVPFNELLNADFTMKDAATLRARFAAAGADGGKPIVTSCGTGVTACILALGLKQAGLGDAAIYDGSWTEWAGRPETQKEKSS